MGGFLEGPDGQISSNDSLPFVTRSTTGGARENTQEPHGVSDRNPPSEMAPKEGVKRFACPYFKHDPRKEHLYRKHYPSPNRCTRCLVSFKTGPELLLHQRSPEACQVKSETSSDGEMTTEQRSRLRTKKRDGSLSTEEDKWCAIYRILFPGITRTSVPSPYYQDEDELHDASSSSRAFSQDYEEFLKNHPPHDLMEKFKREILHVMSSAGDVNDQVEKMSDITWRLPMSTLRRYAQIST
ncbi:hypothetical protein ACJZ2D_002928 [Fusarium nematophilum]